MLGKGWGPSLRRISYSPHYRPFKSLNISNKLRNSKKKGVMSAKSTLKFIILPGNGCDDAESCMWYPFVADELARLFPPPHEVILRTMPDPMLARRSIWIPHIRNEFQANENTVLIGHSSGAEAAMRYMEEHKILGAVLVSACVTDLGVPSETASGYYKDPWEWDKMKANSKFVIQFGSTDDPFIPIKEMREIQKSLTTEYYEFTRRGHFQDDEFPELIEKLHATLKKLDLA